MNYGDGVSYKSTLSNGNLTATYGTNFSWAYGSIGIPNNAKTYIEYTVNSYTSTGNGWIGFSDVASIGVYFGVTVNGSVYIGNGSYNVNDSPGFATGDILGFAVDRIGNTLTLYKNGSQVYNVALAYGITSSTVLLPAVWTRAPGDRVTLNAGQRPWAYAPPAGFTALTTKNFARLTAGTPAANPNQYFDAVTWTGTGAAQTITLPGAFQPDLVWTKSRSFENNHHLFDSVRGSTVSLKSNTTAAEDVRSTTLQAFNSNGFSLGSAADVNGSGSTYVAWCWRAGGAAVSNTSGTLTSQVSANTASGFSIVTYTGTGSAATVGHGLGTALSMVTIKQRNGVNNWPTWHSGISGGTGYYVYWDSTNGLGTSSTVFNGTNPTSSVFSVGTNSLTNGSTNTYVAYCWAEVAGFSKFGSYTANGSVDGPFIYCGFKPRFIMIKSTSASSQWVMIDTARDTFNSTASRSIFANGASAEETGNTNEAFDIVSNGFKLRSNGRVNVDTVTHIFMAFAEAPFGNVNGVAR